MPGPNPMRSTSTSHRPLAPRPPRRGARCAIICLAAAAAAAASAASPPAGLVEPPPAVPSDCLESGDGYFRARLGGAIDTTVDWPNSGTQCQGESKGASPGVRLSFQRASHKKPDLLFVFGVTGIREGAPAHAAGANLTVIVQGPSRIYGTLGDTRCTVDSLAQRPLKTQRWYRVEARGFCTQPAHAVRGRGEVLVSTFEFAGLVIYDAPATATPARAPAPAASGK